MQESTPKSKQIGAGLVLVSLLGAAAVVAEPTPSRGPTAKARAFAAQIREVQAAIDAFAEDHDGMSPMWTYDWNLLFLSGYIDYVPQNPYMPGPPVVQQGIAASPFVGCGWVWDSVNHHLSATYFDERRMEPTATP